MKRQGELTQSGKRGSLWGRLLSILLAVCMMITMLPVTALADVGDIFDIPISVGTDQYDWTFKVLSEPVGENPGTVQIGVDGVAKASTLITGALTIPSQVVSGGNTYTVTKIGEYAFYGYSGLSGNLTIPNTVTTIAEYAFTNCTGFTGNLTIPSGVTSIGERAFTGCTGFDGNLTIPSGVTSIGEYAFYGCDKLSGSLTIPDTVTTIGEYAFNGCTGFTGSLTISSGITSIGESTFYNCTGFTGNLTIPSGVTSIGKTAFASCIGFTALEFGAGSVLTTIDMSAFAYCNGFTGDLTIPSGVTLIGLTAFYECTGFTGNLTIPGTVTTIGNSAFYGCSGFTGNLTISPGVTSIGQSAFYECRGFTGNLTIPSGVTAIGAFAFYGCSGFTGDLTIPGTVTTIGEYAFRNCSGFTGNLTISSGVTTIGEYAFTSCSGFTGNLTIPDTVTTIGNHAFASCSKLSGNLTIPSGVTSIGENAFAYCSRLTGNLTIPSGVTSIGQYAFAYCIGFTGNLTIPDTVTTIGQYAFASCSKLSGNLTIPSGVTSIGQAAFYKCSGFTGNLTIPSGVTAIGQSAFYDCQPDSVTLLSSTAPSVESGSFNGTYKIIVPQGATGYDAGNWTSYSSRIIAPPAITSIVASNDGSNTGLGIGDKITITFDQNTNKSSISAATINLRLKLNNGHNWGTDLNNTDIAWNAEGNILTITFSSTMNSTIAVEDTITLDSSANIKDSGSTTPASTASGTIIGSFTTEDITAASVTITAPVLGAAYQDAEAVEAATANLDYSVTDLVWNESLTAGGKFKAGQVYTATVTLTSKNGKKFQAATFTPTVAGSASVGTTTTAGGDVVGNTISFTVYYAATGALEVSSIAVTTQPAKMSYTESTDSTLVLNGMQVTETNNDGSTNIVTFTDGTQAGYTTNPANGSTLTNADHNGNPVVITHTASGETSNTNPLTVNTAPTPPPAPTPDRDPTPTPPPVITVSEVKSELFENAEDIKVEADVTIAFGKSVEVKITDSTESEKEIFSLAGAEGDVYPFDISLYSKGSSQKVQPKDGYSVKITIPVPEKLLGDKDKIKVVYGKDGVLETLKSQLIEKDGKWYISFEASHFSPYALVVISAPAISWTNPFSDIKESDWYYSAVKYVAENGLMFGTGSNTFSPELTTNRGMIATILYRLSGSSEIFQSTFKDVIPDAYYAKGVSWAQEKGIIAGYGNGMFGPEDSITREQMATILWRYAGSPVAVDSKGLAGFKDAGEISLYAKDALTWIYEKGIIAGKGNGILDPKGKATRAEVAQIMYNFEQKAGLTE